MRLILFLFTHVDGLTSISILLFLLDIWFQEIETTLSLGYVQRIDLCLRPSPQSLYFIYLLLSANISLQKLDVVAFNDSSCCLLRVLGSLNTILLILSNNLWSTILVVRSRRCLLILMRRALIGRRVLLRLGRCIFAWLHTSLALSGSVLSQVYLYRFGDHIVHGVIQVFHNYRKY